MRRALAALSFAFALVACVSPNSLDGSKRDPADGRLSNEALACTEKPTARSYASFDGKKLEAGRVDQNGSANRARFKPYHALAPEIYRILGVIPFTPAGLGLVELGLTGALVAFGASNADAVAATLLYRALTVLPTLALGALAAATWRTHHPGERLESPE